MSTTGDVNPEVVVSRQDGVATILLNRGSESNPIGWSLGTSLLAALDEVEDDKSVTSIVLTGAGKNFCAGAKLGEVVRREGADPEDQYYGFRDIVRAVSRIRSHELPIVCALNGGAVGGGAALAVACDLIISSERGYCLFAFGRMGASAADMGMAYLLPRLIGMTRARHLLLTGGRLDAKEGKEAGLFLDVVPHDSLIEASHKLAREIGESAPRHALTATKQVLMRGETTEFETCLMYERYLQSYFLNGDEHKKRLNAFLDSRPARQPK
ncbi:enoyl-CoA hydratase-related protein [soil metagenome]